MISIPVFVGISERFKCIEGMTETSILENTSAQVDIVHLYPIVEEGCTGFSNVRYQIKHGIYLDCDMIVMGDIAELWAYRKEGKYVCIQDGSTEVAVIDCESHSCRHKRELEKLPRSCDIPMEWNVEDIKTKGDVPRGTKLVHYTKLETQPWIHGPHPNPYLDALWRQYVGNP